MMASCYSRSAELGSIELLILLDNLISNVDHEGGMGGGGRFPVEKFFASTGARGAEGGKGALQPIHLHNRNKVTLN